MELQAYFAHLQPGQAVRAIPGAGLNIPIWLLGSSLFSAELAAEMGLPFAFASHFAPDYLLTALDAYRSRFRPSTALAAPYAMVGIGGFAADTDQEARRLLTSAQQQFINLRRGTPGPLPPPVDSMNGRWSDMEKLGVERALSYAAVGSATTVREHLKSVLNLTRADEIIVTSQIFDHAARLRSFEIIAGVRALLP
jgi:luciferase family oxidoreductase group 1